MLTFEKLESRYHLQGVLELQQAMHIGCGESSDDIDSLFVKDGSERHYIPGSSLRGALRGTVERIGSAIDERWCCGLDAESENQCPSGNRAKQQEMEKLIGDGKKKESEICKILDAKLCPACKTFGSPFLSSRIRIADLYPVNNQRPPWQKRFGVAIDRDTETAAQGLLFTYQVVEADQKFDFELWAENMDDPNWGMLGIGLLELLGGNFWIGGKKNGSGLGQCRLLENCLKLEYFHGAAELRKYLANQEWPAKKSGGEVKQFLKSKVEILLKSTA